MAAEKPSFLGLLNRVSIGESGAGVFLSAWADTTTDPDVEKTLRMVAMRETEHGVAFEKRIMELGYALQKPDETAENPLIALVTDTSISDIEKLEKALGQGKPADPDAPDPFASMFASPDIDPVTGALFGRFIAEEKDSGRMFKACYEATVAKHGDAPAASGGGSGLVAELEKLAKLHQDDCLTAEEFADAKKMLIGGSKL